MRCCRQIQYMTARIKLMIDMECSPTEGSGWLETENRLLRCLSSRVVSGLVYGLQFSIYHPGAALVELSTAQSFLLALFHSLLIVDVAECSALLRICNELQHLRSSHLAVWLRDDFVFPCNDVARVIKALAHLVTEGKLVFPDHIVRVFTGLAKQYGVPASCMALHDLITLDFLTNYDVPLTIDVGTMTVRDEDVICPCTSDMEEQEGGACKEAASDLVPSSAAPCIANPDISITTNDNVPLKEERLHEIINSSSLADTKVNHLKNKCKNRNPESDVFANIGSTQNSQLSALHRAAQQGQSAIVKELLFNGVDPNEKDSMYGNTAAHWAIKTDKVEILNWLLNHGANLSERNNQGLSPLHIAAEFGKTRSLVWLLDKGVNIDIVDNRNTTPLSRAATKGQVIAGEILIDRGADIDSRDQTQRTPLFYAVMEGHNCMVRLLLQHGADALVKDTNSKTLIHAAIASGDMITFHFIFKQSIDIDAKDCNGRTALHDAAERADSLVVTSLVVKGANMEAKDFEGCTPLYRAVESGQLENVRQLLQHGANANRISDNGVTPADVATDSRMKRLLLSGGRTYSRL